MSPPHWHAHTYRRTTSTKSSSFCMTTFSKSLTHLMVLLPQSRDYSCYVSRPIRAPPPLWLQKRTDLRAHDFAHCHDLWHQPRLDKFTCKWSWRLYGITHAIHLLHFYVTSYRVYKRLITCNSAVMCISIQEPVVVRNRSRSSYLVSVLQCPPLPQKITA